jgi:hypothetical protein
MSDWRMKFFLWIGLPVIAALGLGFGAQDVIPSWDAMNGKGTAGTFTAKREDCGRRSCSFYGDWVSSDGAKTRPDVILYDEPDSMRVGDSTDALDSGARSGVYTKGGSSTFYLTLAFTLAGVAAAIGFIFVLLRRFTRKREPAPATA